MEKEGSTFRTVSPPLEKGGGGVLNFPGRRRGGKDRKLRERSVEWEKPGLTRGVKEKAFDEMRDRIFPLYKDVVKEEVYDYLGGNIQITNREGEGGFA